METGWLYKGKAFDDELVPEIAIGFIYLMTHKPSGKKYIGRKLLTQAHSYQRNKKIIKTRKESNWKDYWSSSPLIAEMIESEGTTDNFEREILVFAHNKSSLNYLEEKFCYVLGVLEKEEYLNSNIRSKMYRRNVFGKLDTVEINNVLGAL